MYATADIDHTVAATNNADTYNVKQGVTRLPDIEKVPFLDTVAVLNAMASRMSIFVVNRHLTLDLPASINLSGFEPAADGKAMVLSAASLDDVNDEEKPEAIIPIESHVHLDGNHLQYTFRHESVVRIELSRR